MDGSWVLARLGPPHFFEEQTSLLTVYKCRVDKTQGFETIVHMKRKDLLLPSAGIH